MADKPPKPENKAAAPRFKQRGNAEQKVAESSDPIRNSAEIGAELKAQTDRGAAIIAGSVPTDATNCHPIPNSWVAIWVATFWPDARARDLRGAC
jgi:hypothetical protein